MAAVLQGCNSVIESAECLNIDDNTDVMNVFNNDGTMVKSDADVDADLLLKVQFRQPIHLNGIVLTHRNPASENVPQSVTVFLNNPNLDFAGAQDEKYVAKSELKSFIDGSKMLPLPYVKCQNVTSIQLFLTGEGECSELNHIEFIGKAGENSDIKEWKPVKG